MHVLLKIVNKEWRPIARRTCTYGTSSDRLLSSVLWLFTSCFPFYFLSMNTPLHPEGHRWRITRAPDTCAVQQDIYWSSCKITHNLGIYFCSAVRLTSTFYVWQFLFWFFYSLYCTLSSILTYSITDLALCLRWPFGFLTLLYVL